MRYDVSQTSSDSLREVVVTLFQTSTLTELIDGTATGGIDLTPFVYGGNQTHSELSLRLAWHSELYGSNQPAPGHLIRLTLNGSVLWHGIIESVNDYRLAAGERTMSITARSRDSMPLWRQVRFVTDSYPAGTNLTLIAQDIAEAIELTSSEYTLAWSGACTAQSSTQLADIAPWEMLSMLFEPSGFSPLVDAIGRLKLISRDTSRSHDIEVGQERLVGITGGRSRAPLSAIRLKWRDPLFTKVGQQDQQLTGANITAGYFQIRQSQDVKWSEDGSQRAENTRLVVKQSANSGLFHVCSENYDQLSLTSGRITLETSAFVPALMSVFLAIKAAGMIPDIAPPFGGPTNPVGRMVHAALELSVLLTTSSVGTGVYEIWGTPFDYVNARNTTEAYVNGSPRYVEQIVDIESDFVPNESSAQTYAARELVYRYRESTSWNATIVDDPRIEPGDIILLPDASRLYVTGYSRDLTPGSPAILSLEGFRV